MDTLKRAAQLAERREYSAALQLCDNLLLEDPANADALRGRAFILARMDRLREAITDMLAATHLAPLVPNDAFFLGYWSADLGDAPRAIEFLTSVVKHEVLQGKDYFSETAKFYRASAYIDNGQPQYALYDLADVRADFQTFLKDKIVTRAELERVAHSLKSKTK